MSDDSDVPAPLPKVVLVGNYGVGKTTLFQLLTQGANRRLDSAIVRLPEGTKVKLEDTCDMERCGNLSLTGSYYREAACVLLVCDVTNVRTVQSLQGWKENSQVYAPKAQRILVMNKIDSPEADRILLGSIESYRERLECCFNVLMSARTGQGVAMLLDRIEEACRLRKSQARRETRESIMEIVHLHQRRGNGKKKKLSCCQTT